MRSLRRPVRALLLAGVAWLLWPDSAATGCPLADLADEGLDGRVETAQLSGIASAWGDHVRDVEFRHSDNDPFLPPSIHSARFQVERNPQRPQSRRGATTFRLRTRVPRGPPPLLS